MCDNWLDNFRNCSAAARPISTVGVRMLVNAGVYVAPRSVLSTPLIEMSSGMRTPCSRHAIIATPRIRSSQRSTASALPVQ